MVRIGKKKIIEFGWNHDMDSFFGKTLHIRTKICNCIKSKECDWSFSRQMLKSKQKPLSREEVISLFETMILGNN